MAATVCLYASAGALTFGTTIDLPPPERSAADEAAE